MKIFSFELCPLDSSLSPMKHSGKATQACLKMLLWSLLVVIGLCALGIIAEYLSAFIHTIKYVLIAAWVAFAGFCVYFFRDPSPQVPAEKGLILSPGHGTVDVIEEYSEAEFIGGPCRRISMFLSPLDVHVQNAPVAGKVAYVHHHPGKFLAAMRTDCGLHNENVMVGLESSETKSTKIGVRLIAGVLARRIIPWVRPGDLVGRGERISLIQFGSRCDVYLPLSAQVAVKIGDKLKGGESVLARLS